MKERILIAIDIHQKNEHILNYGAYLANTLGKDVHLFHNVAQPKSAYLGTQGVMDYPAGDIVEMDLKAANTGMQDLQKKIRSKLSPVLTCTFNVSYGVTETNLMREAKEIHPVLILMGKHEEKNFLDSIIRTSVNSIVNKSDCPVMIVSKNSKARDIQKMFIIDESRGEFPKIVHSLSEEIDSDRIVLNDLDELESLLDKDQFKEDSIVVYPLGERSFFEKLFSSSPGVKDIMENSEAAALIFKVKKEEHVTA